MKILKHGDERVIKIIKKKHLDGDAGYKVSQFVYQFSEGGRYLLRNTLTKETAEKVLENLDVSLTEAKMVAASGKLDNLM